VVLSTGRMFAMKSVKSKHRFCRRLQYCMLDALGSHVTTKFNLNFAREKAT
jgi:hypothetical protein